MPQIVMMLLAITIPPSEQTGDDHTAVVQEWLNAAVDVDVPFTGKDWIVEPLHLRDGNKLTLATGVRLVAKPGAYRGKQDSLINAERVQNVAVIGPGATLVMHRQDYAQTPYPPSEWRHAINLRGVDGVQVKGLSIVGPGGDGVYVGPTWDDERVPCKDVRLENLAIHHSYRQGISVVSADNLYIGHVDIDGTMGASPQAAIDLEPSHPRDVLNKVYIEYVNARSNRGAGLFVNVDRLDATSRPVDVLAWSVNVYGSDVQGIRLVQPTNRGARGRVWLWGCTVDNNLHEGFYADWHMDGSLRAVVLDSVFRRVGIKPDKAAFAIRSRGGPGSALRFVGCVFHEHKATRKAWWDVVGPFNAHGVTKRGGMIEDGGKVER